MTCAPKCLRPATRFLAEQPPGAPDARPDGSGECGAGRDAPALPAGGGCVDCAGRGCPNCEVTEWAKWHDDGRLGDIVGKRAGWYTNAGVWMESAHGINTFRESWVRMRSPEPTPPASAPWTDRGGLSLPRPAGDADDLAPTYAEQVARASAEEAVERDQTEALMVEAGNVMRANGLRWVRFRRAPMSQDEPITLSLAGVDVPRFVDGPEGDIRDPLRWFVAGHAHVDAGGFVDEAPTPGKEGR